MRYKERAKLKAQFEAEWKRQENRRKRNWKRIAGLPAFCYSCKKESTYAELAITPVPHHPHKKDNRCEECFNAELSSPGFDDDEFDDEFDDIPWTRNVYWKGTLAG